MKNMQISISSEDEFNEDEFLNIKEWLFIMKFKHPELDIFYITENNSELIK